MAAGASGPPGHSFGALLKYLRRRARLTQRDLALAVGYSPEHVCRLEQNQRTPDLATIMALFVPALRLEDAPELVAHLIEQAATARGESLAGQHVALSRTVRSSVDHTATASAMASSISPSPLIGRRAELTTLRALLGADARLVTLTGPPGVGKTRLALAAAETLAGAFDGVFVVPLAAVHDASVVPAVVARTLGARAERAGSSSPLHDIVSWVGRRRVLLVLDNFEQIVGAAPMVAELLASCPALRVIVTSRQRLHVRAEQRLPVAPLALPPGSDSMHAARAMDAPAVALFVERARAVQPDWELTDTNVRDVVAICRALDGLPLAIELLAARAGALTAAELAARLDRRLALLTGGPRDLPPRQRALRDSIAWSYELLARPERALFRRVGAFAGGWTAAAAREVCSLDMDAYAVTDGLAALGEASLITRSADGRYQMLETVREFAAERLAEVGEAPLLRRRLLAYLHGLCAEVKQHADGDDQLHWLGRLEAERANIRAAILSVAAERHPEQQDVAAVVHLGGELVWYWNRLDDVREGSVLSTAVLELGERAWRAGIIASPNTQERARMLNLLGYFALADGDFAAADAAFERSLAIYCDLGHTRGIANVVNNMGILARDRGRYDQAQQLYTRSFELERELGDAWGIAMSYNNLALLTLIRGNIAEARALFTASLRGFTELGDELGVAECMMGSARTALAEGDLALARRHFEASLGRLRELRGERRLVYICLFGLAAVAAAEGDTAAAREQLHVCLLMLRDTPELYAMAECLSTVGAVLHAEGRLAEAAALLAPVQAFLQRTGASLYPDTRAVFERTVAAVQACADDPAVATALARSRTWTLQRAVERAAECVFAAARQYAADGGSA